MCEAIYVARERGLHAPRKAGDIANDPIGPPRSEPAESLIANVLRYALDDARLAAARRRLLVSSSPH